MDKEEGGLTKICKNYYIYIYFFSRFEIVTT